MIEGDAISCQRKLNVLFLSAVYPPDPAAVGQYMADVADETAHRGHRVKVITANRGYDDPSLRLPTYELRHGVEVYRLSWSSLGKKSLLSRVLGQCSFTFQGLVKAMLGLHPDVVLVSTIPPFGIAAALLLAKIRKSALVFWVMDINPDEAIAMGMVHPRSLSARLMEYMNRLVLRAAKAVITLDSYMALRLHSKICMDHRLFIVSPWPLEETITKTKGIGLKFQREHGLDGKFIVMYSGNHSWVHPLDTLLEAAKKLIYRSDILFVFIGEGVEKKKVELCIKSGMRNIRSLPYQKLDHLGASLSAADVHVVVMGEAMVGIVHPSKIYGAMAVERPILAIAPDRSFISEIVDGRGIGFRLHHGDVNGVVNAIVKLADMEIGERIKMGEKARALVRTFWNQAILRKKVVDLLEQSALMKECRI